MTPFSILIQPVDTDGTPIKETLQWYLDEVNNAVFTDQDAKDSVLDFIQEIINRIGG